MINSGRVRNIFGLCLYMEDELEHDENNELIIPEDSIKVEGITGTVYFNPIRINYYKDEIKSIVKQLHHSFEEGWSFLNMCLDINNEQWTGVHRTMEELLDLGLAAKCLEYCTPREIWDLLPNKMPYVKLVR